MRTFVAIELPSEVKSRLGDLQSAFGEHARALKWVRPDLLHITLRFLGAVPQPRLEAVELAARAAAGRGPFTLTIDGLGAFPQLTSPRVIWVGIARDGTYRSLAQIHETLGRELAAAGFGPEDRPFSPHITLARTRDGIAAAERRAIGVTLLDVMEKVGILDLRVPVKAVTVMRSDLASGGPRYTPLAICRLGQGHACAVQGADAGKRGESAE